MTEKELREIFDEIHEKIYDKDNRQKITEEINADNNLNPEKSLSDHFISFQLTNLTLEREFLFQVISRLLKDQNFQR